MVGVFSRLSVRSNHRRTQSALDERDELPPNLESTTNSTAAASGATHGIEIAVQFKPIEHPTEPLDNDQPIQCPLPEPSILNDGRIWKERVSFGSQKKGDVPVAQEESPVEAETPRTKHGPPTRGILPSISAPEHNILKLLEECNAYGINFNNE